ncbi:TonB-dependent siderophore receptor [Caulobacter sp. UNC279MFTsu5.1]|uniref:TonB-dependent receptor plug domain-containing protein n=1 Tax=Caulobacter sp. UNC279MFTsu5.1 TaxID=1502775 RepID=UPI0008E9906F|nr:TonB-dependent receptor [Caulobacter sp. UNC279MFTsu5.1]SFK56101.1 vitamin B12 transporter [Caulobacter sp. UNC279MFTsu5.1]
MRSTSILALVAALPALALPSQVLAADAVDAPSEVDQIVVTAGRAADKLSETPVSMTVIDAETLRQRQAVVVSDLLSRTPGVTVTRNGGVGGSTQVRIRGAESDQTAVLIDGVKLSDPSATGGGYNFATLLAGDVDRIEVLRGPQSTLWGSQAIGGVVSMITKTPDGPLAGDATVEGGSRATAYARVGVGAGGDWGGWRLAAGSYTTAGVSNFDQALGGKEKDGYRNTALSGRLDLKATDWASLDARLSYAKGRNEFDGFPAPLFSFADTAEYGKTKELVSYLGARLSNFDGALNSRIGYSYTQTDRDNYDPSQAVTTKTFDAKGTDNSLEYQGTWTINPVWRAVFGVSTERSWFRTAAPSSFDPTPTPDRHATGMDSVYGQLQAKLAPGLTLTGGVRHDDHDTFGGATTYQAGATWSPNGGATVIRANYGEGFKAPSLYQLYSDYGNTSLKPEEARSWDVSVEHSVLDGRLRGAITYFNRDTKNQIDFMSNNTPPNFGGYANTAKTQADGVEVEGSFEVNSVLTLSANYTNMDAVNRSAGPNYGKDLARRAGETASADAELSLPNGLTGGVTMQYVGHSFDNASNTRRLKSYVLTDVRISYPINDTFELYGRIENLFDQQYETLYRYGTLGRGAFAGVRARF